MKKLSESGNGEMTDAKLRTFATAIMGRAQLASKLGETFSGKRNLYEALGYKTELTYIDYLLKYTRQDIAKAIINRPIKATWRGEVNILESTDDDETALEKQWKKLVKDLKLKSKFIRLDRLTSIGEYAVLLLGFNDVSGKDQMNQPVTRGNNRKLLYVRPVSQHNAEIVTWERNPRDPRFGQPLIYELTLKEPGSDATYIIRVHHSRIIHTNVELLEDEVSGEPILKALYNRLDDLEKLVGGSAEMFWKGARPGYSAKVDGEHNLGSLEEEELIKQVDEYEHELRRILLAQGLELNSLATQISDPSNHVDIQIQMISAITGIPKRILVGSERGELSSMQDQDQWKELIQDRREEYAENIILIPFIDRLIEYGALPPLKSEDNPYTIQWSDLYAPSEKEKSEVGRIKSAALKEYASNPGAGEVIPPEAFMNFFLGLDEDQINLITEMKKQQIAEEEEFERDMEETEETEE